MSPRTAVVVPCFDEAPRLRPEEFLSFLEHFGHADLVLVDDGSGDGTLEVLSAIAERAPEGRARVVRLARNQGKAEAVRQGVLAALEDSRVSRVGFWDADLATPLDALPIFEEALDAAPGRVMAIGSRIQMLGHTITRRAFRHATGRIAATLISASLGIPVYDTQCGAKLFRVDHEIRGLFAEPFLTRWLFDVEILARWIALHPGAAWREAIVEIPLPSWVDVPESRITAMDLVETPFELWRIERRYHTHRLTRG